MLTKEQEKRIREHFFHIYPDGKLVLHTRPERIFDDATIHASSNRTTRKQNSTGKSAMRSTRRA